MGPMAIFFPPYWLVLALAVVFLGLAVAIVVSVLLRTTARYCVPDLLAVVVLVSMLVYVAGLLVVRL